MTDDRYILLHEDDNVIVVKKFAAEGQVLGDITCLEAVPSGHKMARRFIDKGDVVRKYAQIIGYAAEPIEKGSHVHTHNVSFRNVSTNYAFSADCKVVDYFTDDQRQHFMGYHRENGQVGTRNFIGVLTSVNCSATAAHHIAATFTPEMMKDYPNVDGVVAFSHGTGCGMADSGDGFAALQRVLWGYARHPNMAGVLLVGLGCEVNQIDFLLEAYGIEQSERFQYMNIQQQGGLRKTIAEGVARIKEMLPLANRIERQKAGVEHLTVALQCGGSDAWSGVTANPALGYAADLLVAHGGTAALAETPEIYGAEHLLTRRSINQEVGEKLIDRIRWWEDYVERNSGSMNNNPSPGNKKGGLTTILEKSLGAVAKGGTTPLMQVYRYGEMINEKGFVFMDSPGYDPCSVTGQIASGCNLVAFTTGRGSAFGSKPAPSIKIATNTTMYQRMEEDMDINAGQILSDNKSIQDVGREIFDLFIQVASGQASKSEQQGLGDLEFVPWQIGATM